MACFCTNPEAEQVTIDGIVYCLTPDSILPTYDNIIPICLEDTTYFKDVSWTVSYSPILGSWLSFYSFKPNFYINHNSYFQTGINSCSIPATLYCTTYYLTNTSGVTNWSGVACDGNSTPISGTFTDGQTETLPCMITGSLVYTNAEIKGQLDCASPTPPASFGTSLWSHLLTNKSYQVFYGDKYPFTIEYGIKDEYLTKTFYNVHLWVEARRYHNNYDYASDIGITFNKALVYNNIGTSGDLNLIPEANRITNSKKYPKTNANNTQDIMITNSDRFRWSYNYFYNRVKNNTSNTPFLLRDDNQIELFTNPSIVSFKGKPMLERITGNWFLNRITYDKDSRYSLIFKFTSSQSEI